ncbi:MAG: hypothetical protein J6P32_07585 [Stomatobaculum sp.]|nr:hypothetical protein [Stomatobaculum sp.]
MDRLPASPHQFLQTGADDLGDVDPAHDLAGEFDKIKKLVAEAAAIVKEVRG